MPETTSNVYYDIMERHIFGSEVQRDMTETYAVLSTMSRIPMRRRAEVEDQPHSVSDTPTISTIEHMFTVTQSRTGLAHSTINRPNILYLHLALSLNRLPWRRKPVSDVTS